MHFKDLAHRFFGSNAVRRTARFVLPSTLYEIQPGFVAAARLERSSRRIRRVGVRELDSGAVVPAAQRPNIAKPEELEQAIRDVTEDIGGARGPLGLLLSDTTVPVSILSFETLPEVTFEKEALIRWKMKDVLPFAPQEARLSYEMISADSKGQIEVVALVARGSVLAEYESMLDPMNGGVGLVLPATVALLPLLPGENSEGSCDLLLHVSGASLTAALVEGQRLRLWRHQPVGELSHQAISKAVATEALRVMASAGDRLHMEVERVWLCARPPATRQVAEDLACVLSRDVQILSCESSLSPNLSPDEKVFLERYGMTFAGLAANGRSER